MGHPPAYESLISLRACTPSPKTSDFDRGEGCLGTRRLGFGVWGTVIDPISAGSTRSSVWI